MDEIPNSPATRSAFTQCLRGMGVGAGDALFVHSSFRALGPFEGGGENVIDALWDAVNPDGLLAVPTHTWDIVNDRQPVWHETLTPSHAGTLTNLLRQRPDAVRSIHPTHSVAAIGARAREFCAGHENDTSPCSPTSPYGRMLDWRGKIMLLGVDLTKCTFIHCLEEIAGFGELWSLTEAAPRFCILENGAVLHMMGRAHKDCVSENFGRAEAELIRAGAIVAGTLGRARLLLVDAAKTADYLLPRFRENPKYFW